MTDILEFRSSGILLLAKKTMELGLSAPGLIIENPHLLNGVRNLASDQQEIGFDGELGFLPLLKRGQGGFKSQIISVCSP